MQQGKNKRNTKTQQEQAAQNEQSNLNIQIDAAKVVFLSQRNSCEFTYNKTLPSIVIFDTTFTKLLQFRR